MADPAGIVNAAGRADDAAFRELLDGMTPDVRDVARSVRDLVYDVLPATVEVVWPRQRSVGWGTGPRKGSEQFAYLLPFARHVTLGFYHGHELPDPAGLLQVSDDLDEEREEGSELTYLHGVAVTEETPVPDGLDAIEVPAGSWAAFRTSGPYPSALQQTWAATATEWFPSNPWRLRPGPSIVSVLERAGDFSTATCELWLPVEPA